MKKFLKTLALFCLPFLVLVGVYAALDPFRVIWHYNCFYDTAAPGRVGLNKDYVSTATFKQYVKERDYNSYILGNSRSIFYEVAEWKKHLPPDASAFHFDAAGDGLYGIARKLAYIENNKARLDNVLLVLDYETLVQDEHRSGHLFFTPPQQVGYLNAVHFQWAFFKAFLQRRFLFAYIDFKLSGEMKPYMTGNHFLENDPYRYDPKTNEITGFYEKALQDGSFYSPDRMKAFYKRDTIVKYNPPGIEAGQLDVLKQISAILARNKTSVKVVVSPLYDQKKLNPADLAILESVFGEGNVFDFSGINDFTKDYRNYFESAHYRPHVAREILREIY